MALDAGANFERWSVLDFQYARYAADRDEIDIVVQRNPRYHPGEPPDLGMVRKAAIERNHFGRVRQVESAGFEPTGISAQNIHQPVERDRPKAPSWTARYSRSRCRPSPIRLPNSSPSSSSSQQDRRPASGSDLFRDDTPTRSAPRTTYGFPGRSKPPSDKTSLLPPACRLSRTRPSHRTLAPIAREFSEYRNRKHPSVSRSRHSACPL